MVILLKYLKLTLNLNFSFFLNLRIDLILPYFTIIFNLVFIRIKSILEKKFFEIFLFFPFWSDFLPKRPKKIGISKKI